MSEQNKDEVQNETAQAPTAGTVVENTTTENHGADVEKALDADEEDGPGDETPVSDEEERETEDSDEDLPDDEDRGDEVDTEADDGGTDEDDAEGGSDDSDAAEEGSTAHTEILNRLSNIVAEQLGVSVGDVKAESNLQDDLGADSLDAVELVMAVEDEFELEIPDEKTESFNTVNDIVNYLIERNVTTG